MSLLLPTDDFYKRQKYNTLNLFKLLTLKSLHDVGLKYQTIWKYNILEPRIRLVFVHPNENRNFILSLH